MARRMSPNGTQPEGPCEEVPRGSLILTGSGITGEDGKWQLVVPPALCCFRLDRVDWVSMVATPSKQSDGDNFPNMDASYLTTAWSTSGGLILFVESWESDNVPKPNVEFSWHAVVLYPGRLPND